MHGIITELDHSQGCGVISCDVPKINVSFRINDVIDKTYLQFGDVVTFTGVGGSNGPEAREVILLWRDGSMKAPSRPQAQETPINITHNAKKVIAVGVGYPLDAKSIAETSHRQPAMGMSNEHRDDRDQCAICRKLMIPTLALVNGTPHQSFCPFCGHVHKDFTKPSGSSFKAVVGQAAATTLLGSIIVRFFGP